MKCLLCLTRKCKTFCLASPPPLHPSPQRKVLKPFDDIISGTKMIKISKQINCQFITFITLPSRRHRNVDCLSVASSKITSRREKYLPRKLNSLSGRHDIG